MRTHIFLASLLLAASMGLSVAAQQYFPGPVEIPPPIPVVPSGIPGGIAPIEVTPSLPELPAVDPSPTPVPATPIAYPAATGGDTSENPPSPSGDEGGRDGDIPRSDDRQSPGDDPPPQPASPSNIVPPKVAGDPPPPPLGRCAAPPPASDSPWPELPWWVYVLAGLILLAVILKIAKRSRASGSVARRSAALAQRSQS